MANIKSWADHCSSDEESDDERIAPPPSGLPGSSSFGQLNQLDDNESDDNNQEEEEIPYEEPPPKEYILPSQPPYTAFIGSLPFSLNSTNDLGHEIVDLLRSRDVEKDLGGVDVRVRDVRLMTDRETGKNRGYGYVEFDTPEEVSFR